MENGAYCIFYPTHFSHNVFHTKGSIDSELFQKKISITDFYRPSFTISMSFNYDENTSMGKRRTKACVLTKNRLIKCE